MLAAMLTNCICSQLLSDGYDVTDAILNITGKSQLRVEEGERKKRRNVVCLCFLKDRYYSVQVPPHSEDFLWCFGEIIFVQF